jgi:hypothetical protein
MRSSSRSSSQPDAAVQGFIGINRAFIAMSGNGRFDPAMTVNAHDALGWA